MNIDLNVSVEGVSRNIHKQRISHDVPVAQWLEHCVSTAKVVGSIPREHMYWKKKKCITWMHCKSLWIKASAKCINVITWRPGDSTWKKEAASEIIQRVMDRFRKVRESVFSWQGQTGNDSVHVCFRGVDECWQGTCVCVIRTLEKVRSESVRSESLAWLLNS